MFAYLALALVVPGAVLLLWVPAPVALGGWIAGAVLAIFAFLLRAAADSLNAKEPTPRQPTAASPSSTRRWGSPRRAGIR